jgi:hypothetical protein
MRRASTVLTTLALTLLASEARTQSIRPELVSAWARVDGDPLLVGASAPAAWFASLASAPTAIHGAMLAPVQAIQPSGNYGAVQPVPFEPVGSPTAWVTAKDLANITLLGGGSGSAAFSCVNKGSAGGTFAHFTAPNPANLPIWYDDGFLGAGLPYLWFTGTSLIRVLEGQFPSSAYVTADAYTIYVVVYAHQLTPTAGETSQNPTVIRFASTGFAINTPDGAILYSKDGNPAWGDYVAAPVASGDATLHVWKLEHAGGLLSMSVDGGVPVTVASGTTQDLSGLPKLGFDCCSFNSGSFHGAISEWIVYNKQLTPGQDRANMAYLRNEWGTP